MLAWQPDARPAVSAQGRGLSSRDINQFLIDSEQRVIAHCHAMLARKDLAPDQSIRLERVLRDAATRLQRLRAQAA